MARRRLVVRMRVRRARFRSACCGRGGEGDGVRMGRK